MTRCLLALNGGSSSIRFAVYEAGDPPIERLAGKVDRIGADGTNLTVSAPASASPILLPQGAADPLSAVGFLLDWLEAQPLFTSVAAVGHRVVHGMERSAPEAVTPALMEELSSAAALSPEHLPQQIALIEAIHRRHPRLPQIACFDTAFHHALPRVAQLLPIPRRYQAHGLRRYGFHGLSYAYLMEELARIDPLAAKGRIILAHLGNGASLAAVREGKSVDTTMGFTPASGLVMGTRSGDLDPGLFPYLARSEAMPADRFDHMANHESGLLGVSETSSDLRDLLAAETTDGRAAEAVELFCYQAKKWIGSFAAVLGGLDTLVFAGGIGENCPSIRARICDGLGFLGIDLDESLNAANAHVISRSNGQVSVRVVRTNEEQMIARLVAAVEFDGNPLIRSSGFTPWQ